MKIVIFSDIHSNLDALQAVMESISKIKYDKIVCLGDIVGYGAEPNECVELIRDVVDIAIMGNHDAAVTGKMDYSYYYDEARYALEWTTKELTSENLEWLRKLPMQYKDKDMSFTHGSPFNIEEFEYLLTPMQLQQEPDAEKKLCRLNFIGHSHLTRSFLMGNGEVGVILEKDIEILPDLKYIITVGSVGQPRDQDNRACYVIYEKEDNHERIKFIRVEYNIKRAAQRIQEKGLPIEFGKRLFYGL